MFTIQAETPVPATPPAGLNGIAYDGASYFFTKENECKIYRYGRRFQREACFDTCRNYTGLCFDPRECCFWAFSNPLRASVFKLNSCFQEIDRIHIAVPGYGKELGCVTGVSYDCSCDRLIVAFVSCLVRVDPCRPEQSAVIAKSTGGWILGVLSICPYILCRCMTGDKHRITIFSSEGKPLKTGDIESRDLIRSAVYVPFPNCSECPHIMVLVSRHSCYSYVLNCTLSCGALGSPILPCNDWRCKTTSPCENLCGECGRSEILDSIAQLENAVSSILAAEGDQLRKATATSHDTAELLQADQSVQKTLTHAARLEQRLYSLLETLQAGREEGSPPRRAGGDASC